MHARLAAQSISITSQESVMKQYAIVGLSILAGAAVGAAAVQTLHAQAKPPAFQVAEVTIKDQDGYNKEFVPLITRVNNEHGGKFLARGGKTASFQGEPPAPRIVIVQFENIDKMQAMFNSAAFKEAIAVGNKYSTQRTYGVEGLSP
jgi:uncharacterized protein (DUF1330 family)